MARDEYLLEMILKNTACRIDKRWETVDSMGLCSITLCLHDDDLFFYKRLKIRIQTNVLCCYVVKITQLQCNDSCRAQLHMFTGIRNVK